MDCLEALFLQTLHHQKLLIEEQQVGDSNPLYRLAQIPHALYPERNTVKKNFTTQNNT
jgi:hypothetical protein